MRVITGTARGRRLKAPKGMMTRPTSDRIKESLFSILTNVVVDADFLDLYAGTGGIGIEALSRGAQTAVFVENNPAALKVIRENLELTGLGARAEILPYDAGRALKTLAVKGRSFDIVFMDPPYRKGLVEAGLKILEEYKLLRPEGLVVAESSKADTVPEQAGYLQMFRQEKYGDTVLTFYTAEMQ